MMRVAIHAGVNTSSMQRCITGMEEDIVISVARFIGGMFGSAVTVGKYS